MFELEEPATALMAKDIGDGRGNYGPDFRYLPPGERSKSAAPQD
jgi:hypothetical protein